MNKLDEVLSQLKDIHEPTPVGWWPLAPGWYILVVAIVVLILMIVFFLKTRRSSVKRLAKIELANIERDFAINHSQSDLIKNISSFLRRVMLSRNAHNNASLTGESWLASLDEQSKAKIFLSGPGRVISDGPYQRDLKFDSDDLLKALKQWLRGLK